MLGFSICAGTGTVYSILRLFSDFILLLIQANTVIYFSVNYYVPELEERGHIVFVLSVILSFCHSVILSFSLKL